MSMSTIPAELVPLVRCGLYVELSSALQEVGALLEASDRETPARRGQHERLWSRIDSTRAALRAVGPVQTAEMGVAQIDVGEHRPALLAALLAQIEHESDQGCEQVVAQLDALVQGVEEAGEAAEAADAYVQRLVLRELLRGERPKPHTLDSLTMVLAPDPAPAEVRAALGHLEAERVVVIYGEQVRPSGCACHIDSLHLITL